MVLLDTALHTVYELPYRCHYAHRRLARLGSSRSWSPHGRAVPRCHRPAESQSTATPVTLSTRLNSGDKTRQLELGLPARRKAFWGQSCRGWGFANATR